MGIRKYLPHTGAKTAARKVFGDWANLGHYREANAKLPPPLPGEMRVVFMGDSITEDWGLAPGGFFPGQPYVNRGIRGQTTEQMLARFRPDVIALHPKLVVIQGGANDIAQNTEPEAIANIEGHFERMVELAQANRIRVVLASLTPVTDAILPQTVLRPPEKIATLNAWIESYTKERGIAYLDYYSAMLDETRMLRQDLTLDGVHPNAAGYALMEPLVEEAIAAALR